ncbi:protein of unknown function [Methylocella tundrae]|uniref:Uncharacterized protein n=1 Tax=Methylocella tundrae TaxID=227605 RepID=A0A4U8Z628_METTU|nr:protein of unknown function [Methylocella tundrae]
MRRRWIAGSFRPRYAVTGAVAGQPAGVYLGSAAAAASGARVMVLRWPRMEGAPVTVLLRGGAFADQARLAYLDPPTGRVLDIADLRGGLIGLAHALHANLMLPPFLREADCRLGRRRASDDGADRPLALAPAVCRLSPAAALAARSSAEFKPPSYDGLLDRRAFGGDGAYRRHARLSGGDARDDQPFRRGRATGAASGLRRLDAPAFAGSAARGGSRDADRRRIEAGLADAADASRKILARDGGDADRRDADRARR